MWPGSDDPAGNGEKSSNWCKKCKIEGSLNYCTRCGDGFECPRKTLLSLSKFRVYKFYTKYFTEEIF